MNTTADEVVLRPNYGTLDVLTIESLGPLVCPVTVRVVGAARMGNSFILVPLVETTAPRGLQPHGSQPRQIRLYIPPSPGMVTFRASPRDMTMGSEATRVLKGYLAFVGADVAHLHADAQGSPDIDHEVARLVDHRTGKRLFHPLDRQSPVTDAGGLKSMILEANSYMMDAMIVDPDSDVLRAPALLATHARALAAAVDGAGRMIRESQVQAKQPSS